MGAGCCPFPLHASVNSSLLILYCRAGLETQRVAYLIASFPRFFLASSAVRFFCHGHISAITDHTHSLYSSEQGGRQIKKNKKYIYVYSYMYV